MISCFRRAVDVFPLTCSPRFEYRSGTCSRRNACGFVFRFCLVLVWAASVATSSVWISRGWWDSACGFFFWRAVDFCAFSRRARCGLSMYKRYPTRVPRSLLFLLGFVGRATVASRLARMVSRAAPILSQPRFEHGTASGWCASSDVDALAVGEQLVQLFLGDCARRGWRERSLRRGRSASDSREILGGPRVLSMPETTRSGEPHT